MTKEFLAEIARRFREAIIIAKRNGEFEQKDKMYNFPYGCCDDAADLFAHYLFHTYNITSIIVFGSYHDGNPSHNCSHAWLELDNIIIDLTGSQFKNESVLLNYNKELYIGPVDEFHMLFEVYRKEHSRGIDGLSSSCWDRMYGLYETIFHYINN